MTAPSNQALTASDCGMLPCPFCGSDGHPEVRGSIAQDGRYVICTICSAQAGVRPSTQRAIAAWNRRLASPAPAAAGQPVRYHLNEPTVEIDGQMLGKGWLLITEDEYATLTAPAAAGGEVGAVAWRYEEEMPGRHAKTVWRVTNSPDTVANLRDAGVALEPLYAALSAPPKPPEAAPFDREYLARQVREAWVRWAQQQPAPKASWLVPYDDLSEPDKEADRQIGGHIQAVVLAASKPPEAEVMAGAVGGDQFAGTCEDQRLLAAGYVVCGSAGDTRWHWQEPNGVWHDARADGKYYRQEHVAVADALKHLAALSQSGARPSDLFTVLVEALHDKCFGIASMKDPDLALKALGDDGEIHDIAHQLLRALPGRVQSGQEG